MRMYSASRRLFDSSPKRKTDLAATRKPPGQRLRPADPGDPVTLEFEPERGFGVYIHWPFCTRICPYCDFNVYAAKTRDPKPLLEAIAADLQRWRDRTGPRRVDSVFFGGGTPSLIPPKGIEALRALVDQLWGLAPGAEISLEANPEDADRFADIAASGVDRLSLGVQSLDNDALVFLGRTHDRSQSLRAIETARPHFRSLSVDAIYALPDQTPGQWDSELVTFLELPVDHLSLYELTIEPGAAFSRAVRRGAFSPADEDRAADLYDLTQAMTAKAGFDAYEISNHARSPDHRSRHNSIYWRSGDWVGAGPGAHGRLTLEGRRLAIEAERRPADYIAQVSEGGGSTEELLSPEDIAHERLIMGLRMADGVDLTGYAELSGRPINEVALGEFADDGLVRASGAHVALTEQGRLLADYIARRLAE